MKNRLLALSLVISLSGAMGVAQGLSGVNLEPSITITPTTPIYMPLPVDPDAPWMGNLSVSVNPFDVSSVSPLHLKYDYKNIPATDSLPEITIYKDGDVSKTDLKKNYYDYSSSKILAPANKNIGPQSGTYDYSWYAQANTEKYLDPGTYVFQVSWTGANSQLPTQSIKFNITNNNNQTPFRISSPSVMPDPFNPNSGNPVQFKFMVYGLNQGEAISSLDYAISNSSFKQVFTGLASGILNGENSLSWNGKDSTANIVPDGKYSIFLHATTNQNRSVSALPVHFQIDATIISTSPSPTPQNSSNQENTNTNSNSNSSSTAENIINENSCAGFTDIKSTDTNCPIYSWVKSAGIFTGNADGTFNPNGLLQRDQVIKTVLEAFKKFQSGKDYCNGINPFPDITNQSWSRQYVCLGKNTKVGDSYLITGYQSGPYQGLFLPANNVNRSEFLAMILRNIPTQIPVPTFKPYSDVDLNQWDSGFAAYASKYLGNIYPQPTLERSKSVTRLEAAKVFYALHQLGVL